MDIQQVIVNLSSIREALDYTPADTAEDIINKSEKFDLKYFNFNSPCSFYSDSSYIYSIHSPINNLKFIYCLRF